jgi:deoxyribodipyrimidine photo-lyase
MDRDGECVVYWAQNGLRGTDNEALNAAVALADHLSVGVLVYFALHAGLPGGTARSYAFLLQGLRDMAGSLRYRGIPLVVRHEDPRNGLHDLIQTVRPVAVVTDRSALRHGRALREDVASQVQISLFEVDSEHIVPLHVVGKAHPFARTIRPVLLRYVGDWLWPHFDPRPRVQLQAPAGIDVGRPIRSLLRELRLDGSVPPVMRVTCGTLEAQRHLSRFVTRSSSAISPAWERDQTRLSPYLRFGHISPAAVVRALCDNADERQARTLEQVFIRRELAANFTWYTPSYATSSALPRWAMATLEAHRSERSQVTHSLSELALAQTGDPIWDAAQRELMQTGTIQPYVRMYWGKRLVEWFADPDMGLRAALWLNDHWALDGRSANGVANIMWCFGLHDRPFFERPRLGLIRPLGASGVRRNVPLNDYLRWTSQLEHAA